MYSNFLLYFQVTSFFLFLLLLVPPSAAPFNLQPHPQHPKHTQRSSRAMPFLPASRHLCDSIHFQATMTTMRWKKIIRIVLRATHCRCPHGNGRSEWWVVIMRRPKASRFRVVVGGGEIQKNWIKMATEMSVYRTEIKKIGFSYFFFFLLFLFIFIFAVVFPHFS